MLVRTPHVAGTFYPADPSDLESFGKTHLHTESPAAAARAVILPHAGYVYSGKTACRVLSRVRVPEIVFLIGPNHWAVGSEFALMPSGEWETPIGNVPVDGRLAKEFLSASNLLEADPEAHRSEHSLEVEVPLLKMKNPRIRIIPLIVGTLDLKSAQSAALAIGERLAAEHPMPLVVISTDMNHYESDAATRKKDRYDLDAILELDAEKLARVVSGQRITMCGFVPVYMLLVMKEALGITKADLVDYTTSAEASGDVSRVVGYAGFIFE